MKLFKKSQDTSMGVARDETIIQTTILPSDPALPEDLYASTLAALELDDLAPLTNELRFTRVTESLQQNVTRSLESLRGELTVVDGVIELATERQRQLNLNITALVQAQYILEGDNSGKTDLAEGDARGQSEDDTGSLGAGL